MKNKWIECDIFLKDYNRTNQVLKDVVKPYVEKFYNNNDAVYAGKVILSWHFFREPQIRWRILAHEDTSEIMREEIDRKLRRLELTNPSLYDRHVFGKHGQEGQEYIGEADYYGEDAWELCYKRWEAGSNLAILLCTSETEKDSMFHYKRDIHLFENQLGIDYVEENSHSTPILKRLIGIALKKTIVNV